MFFPFLLGCRGKPVSKMGLFIFCRLKIEKLRKVNQIWIRTACLALNLIHHVFLMRGRIVPGRRATFYTFLAHSRKQ